MEYPKIRPCPDCGQLMRAAIVLHTVNGRPEWHPKPRPAPAAPRKPKEKR